MNRYRVLDLFSAAAGGWSLGLHRAGFTTVAAAEKVAWRRALYAQNNPDVHLYDDVRSVTAAGLRRDLGFLPDIVVGSPPCQDISGANAKGRGLDGDQSNLYFEALRIVGETRPRWAAFENSDRLRNRGGDAVLDELGRQRYAFWPLLVHASTLGANHDRPRSWIIACDLDQLGRPGEATNADRGNERVQPGRSSRAGGPDQAFDGHDDQTVGADARSAGPQAQARHEEAAPSTAAGNVIALRPRQPDGTRRRATPSPGPGSYGSQAGEMGRGGGDREGMSALWPRWNGGLVRHLQLDDGLSTAMAGLRVAVGGPRGTSGSRLLTSAFGDAVIPQVPEAIGRAIMKVEAIFLEGRN